MNTLVRAIITGFGLRIGSELGKLVAKKFFAPEDADGDDSDDEDDSLGSVTADPPEV
ncbi:hypothetical protein PPSIR1_42069 [Plesiocystis pacifica SIR-1]|uniref:Uncharacterized protein n=1 Tax=Plesiocystis pacifica SIR-1 TaxID=391625 RepID=A6G105_9BACT|nr:hypothetical protein [Plesiocystis pacifica]EDM80543.1 hypothetical protein PPSIR1_42069 [Plesiocystis pacifica SIR-1]